MAVKKIFKDTDNDAVEARPTLEALEKPQRAAIASDSDADSEEDEAPEAVSTSALRQTETQREKDSAAKEEQLRTARRKANKAKEDQLRAARKGKAREQEEDDLQDADAAEAESSSASGKRKRTADRLDPALFAQAEEAFNAARDAAEDEEDEEKAVKASQSATKRQAAKKKRFTDLDVLRMQEEAERDATRVLGTTTIQALNTRAPKNSHPAVVASSSLNKITSLPSKSSSTFLRARLYKRKSSSLLGKNAKSSKKKSKDSEQPFLIHDPLLDGKKKEGDGKQKRRSRSRLEMEERMRGRASATTAYGSSLSKKTGMGPAVGFKREGAETGTGLNKRSRR